MQYWYSLKYRYVGCSLKTSGSGSEAYFCIGTALISKVLILPLGVVQLHSPT